MAFKPKNSSVQILLNHGRTTKWAVLIVSVLLLGVVVSVVFQPQTTNPSPPSTSPFRPMTIMLPDVGPEVLPPAEERLLAAADYFIGLTYVPYALGGKTIGSPKTCEACAACVKSKKLRPDSPQRLTKCSACKSCGIDCSNLVDRIFAKAGLTYRFAPTKVLNSTPSDVLESKYGLLSIDPDLDQVKPGDLAVEDNHVMLVLSVDRASDTLDILHAGRGDIRTNVGGVRRLKNLPHKKFKRQVVRVLRHVDLEAQNPDEATSFAQWIHTHSPILLSAADRS